MEFVWKTPEKKNEIKKTYRHHYIPRDINHDKIRIFREEATKVRDTKGEQAGCQFIKKVCENDLFYLCKEVLGYKDCEEELHNDMCDFLAYAEKTRKNTLVLIPRAHFKSTIATVGRCIQWMIRDPDVAIGLFSGDMKSARKFATEIRNQCEKNEALKTLFPEIFYQNPQRESDKWTTDEFIIKRTQKGIRKKEPTLKIFGLLQNIPTGDHFDRLIGDDIVDQQISSSEDQMAKIEEQLQYLIPLQMTPDDPIHFVGTRYHIKDAYAKMIEDPFFEIYLRKDIEKGECIFKSRFTIEMLERTRLKIGNYKFQCQYRMDPQDSGDKQFKLEWLKYYQPFNPVRFDNTYYNFILVVDPANKQKKESDFTAMVVLAVDADWNFYLVDGAHDKLNPKQRIDAVFDLVKRWSITQVVYETIAFQDTDSFWIKRNQTDKNIYFEIIEVSHRKQNKHDFILSTQPIFMQGKFILITNITINNFSHLNPSPHTFYKPP